MCTYISVRGLEIAVTGAFRRLINQASFKLQEQNFNRFIRSLTTHCMQMVCSYTLIIITTVYSLLTQNCYSLAVMSEVSGEHAMSQSWCHAGHNDRHGPWWSWAAKVRVSRLESPLAYWDKSERRLLSSPSFLSHYWCFSLLTPPSSPNMAYLAFDFPIHSSGVFGRMFCLLAVPSAHLVLYLAASWMPSPFSCTHPF